MQVVNEIILSIFSIFKFFITAYFLVAMHVVLATPGGTGLYLSFNVLAWLLVVIMVALGLWQITLNKKIYYSKMFVWFSLATACLIIPVFYDFTLTDHAIPRILALVGGLAFLFSFYQFRPSAQDKFNLLIVILLAIAIEATLGLAQYFLFEEGFWGGFKIGISRPHGVFLQPNVMASFMATGLAIALYISPRHIIKNLPFPKLSLGLVYFSLFATTFLLVVLQSRTGLISALVVLVLMTFYLLPSSKKQYVMNIAIVMLALISTLFTFNESNIPKRNSDVYENIGARKEIYTVSLDMIKQRPLLGYGYGSFERSFIDNFNRYAIKHPNIGNTITRLDHPHNEFLFWVVEGGIVALIGLLLFSFAFFQTWLKVSRKKSLAFIAMLLPILLHSQLEFPFYSSVSHFLVFIIILWITDSENPQNIKSIQCDKTFLIRFITLLSLIIFIPFFITTLHTANVLATYQKNGYKNIDKLKGIINPVAWKTHLDVIVYSNIFATALKEQDSEKLTLYINWGLKRIAYKPRQTLYSNVLTAMKILNRKEDYDALLAEAKRTYPQHETW